MGLEGWGVGGGRGLSLLTFGTAAWNTNSVIGKGVELVADMLIRVAHGWLWSRSHRKLMHSPFFSNAFSGMPAQTQNSPHNSVDFFFTRGWQ